MSAVLDDILAEQMSETLAMTERPSLKDDIDIIFLKFERNELFIQLIEQAKAYLGGQRSQGEINSFQSDFAGAVYENLAYILLGAAQPQASILLSPDRTAEFYARLHPNAPRRRHPLKGNQIHGFYTPDGAVIDMSGGRLLISSVCDYTLFPRENAKEGARLPKDEYFTKKHLRFRQELARFPQLFRNASLSFFIPKNGYRPKILAGMANFEEMPFSADEFRKYVDSLTTKYHLAPVPVMG
ncbi:hypothetical protein HY637_01985 [Candidatus Woesearchaeota archaeon]|nr:hypothetical protein [Candidatus Woesearchaeota archaeon]